MSTDTPAAAPTAEREAFEAFAISEGWAYLDPCTGNSFVWRSNLVQPQAWKLWQTAQARAALSAPVAAQPAASGVDALWVEAKIMELAKVSFAAGIAHGHGAKNDWCTDGKAFAIIDSVRTHLSTALTEAAKDVKHG